MILAIDTATRWTTIALHDGNVVLAERSWLAARTQTEELAPQIQELLFNQKLGTADLLAIGVALGPGSYTGLRIGLGLAKGLALAGGIPIIGIPTLDIVAAATPLFESETLVVVVEAGRRRVIAGSYQADLEGRFWRPVNRPEILSWETMVGRVEQPTVFTGEISADGRSWIARRPGICRTLPPAALTRRGGWLAELAWKRARAGDFDDIRWLTPDYLRRPEGS